MILDLNDETVKSKLDESGITYVSREEDGMLIVQIDDLSDEQAMILDEILYSSLDNEIPNSDE